MTIEDEPSIIYGLDHQARTLCCISADQDIVRFLVGTQTLKHENQVCLLSLDEDSSQVTKISYAHPEGEIWHLSSCPTDESLICTCYSKVDGNKCIPGCSVWKLSEEVDENYQQLSQLAFLETESQHPVSSFEWQPQSSSGGKAFALCENNFYLVDTNTTDKQLPIISNAKLETKSHAKFNRGKWNPHHNSNTVGTTAENAIRIWDIRTMKQSICIESAHSPVVRDIDFNPNKQYMLASGGDDCKIRLWDIRKTDKAMAMINQHSHWVWSVRFNPIHDQLLLSCSSDARVILHCAAALSSEPGGHDSDGDDTDEASVGMEDGVVKRYEEHEESVYCCEWASAEPWIFASLSYDGRVVFTKVPRTTKYQILQL